MTSHVPSVPSQALESCGVCGGLVLHPIWHLDAYPLTEQFGCYEADFPSVDQVVMKCTACGHVQLGVLVSPDYLYTHENYELVSGTSPKLLREYTFLKDFIALATRGQRMSVALEFGANNLTFARYLTDICGEVLACDPLLPASSDDPSIVPISMGIEEALRVGLGSKPQLVVARHTLEHIANPALVIQGLFDASTEDAVLVFEVPSLELLSSKLRFDAVTHQHVHYFSVASVQALASSTGCKVVELRHNPLGSNGGSMLFALARTSDWDAGSLRVTSQILEVRQDIDRFEAEMAALRLLLHKETPSMNGFGASLMLSTVNYHLGGVVERLNYIFDDDPSRSGTSYRNVDVEVRHTSHIEAHRNGTFLITSFENGRAIFRRLSELEVGRIISPLAS